jgi:hypothetical protein
MKLPVMARQNRKWRTHQDRLSSVIARKMALYRWEIRKGYMHPSKKVIGFMGFLLSGFLVLGCIGLNLLSSNTDGGRDFMGGTDIQNLSTEQIESVINVAPPAHASTINSYYASFQDFFFQLRFQAPPESVEVFLEALEEKNGFTLVWNEPSAPVSTSANDTPWWDLASAELLRYSDQARSLNNIFFTLHIAQAENGDLIVYLVAFST